MPTAKTYKSKCITCQDKCPNFNSEGESKPLYCSGCALPGMIDIKNPKCITCHNKQPVFNSEGEKKPLYCSGCALPGMIDIKNPK